MECVTRSHHSKPKNSNVAENKNDLTLDNGDLVLCETKISEQQKISVRTKILKFLFPLHPLKVFHNVHLISFLAMQLALRLVLVYFSIPIRPFGVRLSFAWLPVYIAGFFLGPIPGVLFGAACDSLAYLCSGGVWFWMYAIQEPVVGLLSGLMGSAYYLIKVHNIKVTMILQKIITYSFICFTIIIIVYEYYIIDGKFSNGGISNVDAYVPVAITVMLIYLIVNEVQTDLLYKKIKNQKKQEYFIMYCYASILVIAIITLFSFVLGPVIFVEFIRYTTGMTPNNYLKYGAMFYLIPRVLKESIKTPIYIILLTGIIFAIRKPMISLYNLGMNKW